MHVLITSCSWSAFPALFQVYKTLLVLFVCVQPELLQKYPVNSLYLNVNMDLLIQCGELVWLSGHQKLQFLSVVVFTLGSVVLLSTLNHQMLCYSLCWQAAYNLHQTVYRCAMLWRQKTLYKKLNKPCSFGSPLKKQVTFKIPDVSLETKGRSAEEKLWPSKCNDLPFHFAGGDSILSEL